MVQPLGAGIDDTFFTSLSAGIAFSMPLAFPKAMVDDSAHHCIAYGDITLYFLGQSSLEAAEV